MVARLVLGYGLLVGISIALISLVFYFGTIVVLQNQIDARIAKIANREWQTYDARPNADLVAEIGQQLTDNFNSDTEIYLLLSASGQILAGNLQRWPVFAGNRPVTARVIRDGQNVTARLVKRTLGDGRQLIVGWELSEVDQIRQLVGNALSLGGFLAALVVIVGAAVFRRQVENRIAEIRHAAQDIGAGDLSRRIRVAGQDEFGLLSLDINRMLDQIEHLMDGVRHVSNAIAHDLRTPLGRVRNRLDAALRTQGDQARGESLVVQTAAVAAIADIDHLILVFDRLLQIAEVESGVHTQTFQRVDLDRILHDMAELYDASAEVLAMRIEVESALPVLVRGDRNLLANAVTSLLDNALKYASDGGLIRLRAFNQGEQVWLEIEDHGPGIPEEDLPKVTTRFYRVDRSRHLPGNGLGLSIVSAIAKMHGGALILHNTPSGLLVRLVLPATSGAQYS